MYPLMGYVGDTVKSNGNTAEITQDVKNFYAMWKRTQALTNRVIDYANVGILTKTQYDRHFQLMYDFRNLLVELQDALTPAQFTEITHWLMTITPELAVARTKALAGVGYMGIAPLVVVTLIVAGSLVTIGVTKTVADALARYKTNLALMEKQFTQIDAVYRDVQQKKVEPQTAVEVIKSVSQGATYQTASTGRNVFDILGENMTTFAMIGLGLLVFGVLRGR